MRHCECGKEAIWFHQDRFWCEDHWKVRPVEPQDYQNTVPDAKRFQQATDVLSLLDRVERLERIIEERTADS